jgi:predicted N-acetyltransferase YhbS
VTIKIRQAKPLDASNLYRILEEAHGESDGAYPPTDPHMGLDWITRTLNTGYVVVADVSGRLVGSLALTNYQFPWSPQWYLYLEWLYVQKKFRKMGAFNALMAAAHAFSEENNAPMYMAIDSASSDIFLKDKAMAQKGYDYCGGTFIRRQDLGQGQDTETNIPASVMG